MKKETTHSRQRFNGLLYLMAIIAFTVTLAHNSFGVSPLDLTELSIEDLMNIRVTSVSKKSQSLSEAAAAVFVITQEDIRRSGVTTIPDALRMVPGVQVASLDANKWAVTARGTNGRFANKLLVLVDGRSVYTPIFSGVYWDTVDMILEDIDRIEVIRGPGASLWGSNAVNGVINIISKSADNTKGLMVSGLAGSTEKGNLSLRYGGQVGEETPYRVYAKGFKRDGGVDSQGNPMPDDWHYLRGGFRIDHHKDSSDLYTVQGDIYDGTIGETIAAPSITYPYISIYDNENKEKGYNILARWTRTLSDRSGFSLQTYFNRDVPELHLGKAVIHTCDIDFQHRFPIGHSHDFTWGAGYRLYKDKFTDMVDELFTLNPESKKVDIISAFAQDEISFYDQQCHLIIGSKFEYNDNTHFEIQPNARLLYKPNERHTFWGSVSYAVRTPSRVETDFRVLLAVTPPAQPGGLPAAIYWNSSKEFDSEQLMAYELGYKVKATPQISLDASLYYNEYKDLREAAQGMPYLENIPSTHVVIPINLTNDLEGDIYGFELASNWIAADWLSFKTAYTFMKNNIDIEDTETMASQDPRHQISLRAAFDLPRNVECDVWYRYVDKITDIIDTYDTMDIRLGWKCSPNLTLSFVGRNLLNSHHLEGQPEVLHSVGTEVERAVYGKIVWSFD